MAITTVQGQMLTAPLTLTGNLTFSDSSTQTAAASPYVLKNRIINGAMVIDQRASGASSTAGNGTYTTCDRWITYSNQSSKFTVQQNAGAVTPPSGYTNYLGATSSSSFSAASGDYFGLVQYIEGYNISDLSWGAASAQTITLSFWVRSSLTGTFGVALANSANNRTYLATYTISSANTWEQKTVTISGDTSGTWVVNNGIGIRVWFDLGSGSAFNGTAGSWGTASITKTSGSQSIVGTSGATFYITGVQLEQNTSATPFERRLYNQELANCQRYYYRIKSSVDYGLMGWGQGFTTSIVRINVPLPVTMRVPATGFDYSAANTYLLVSGSNNPTVSSVSTSTNSSLQIAQIQITTSTSATVSAAFDLFANASAAAYIGVIAEL